MADPIQVAPLQVQTTHLLVQNSDLATPSSVKSSHLPSVHSISPLFARPSANWVSWSNKQRQPCKTSESTLLYLVSAFVLSRIVLVIIAEKNELDQSSLGHIIMVLLPFFISIENLCYFHDMYISKNDFCDYVYSILRCLALLGLGWVAPSSYISSTANLPTFIFFLFSCRALTASSLFITASCDSQVTSVYILKSMLSLIPMGLWIASLFQVQYNNLYLLFQLGVAADVLSTLMAEVLQLYFARKRFNKSSQDANQIPRHQEYMLRYIHATLVSNHGWSTLSRVLILAGLLIIFPLRQGQPFPIALVAMPFDLMHFIYGFASLIIITGMVTLYDFNHCAFQKFIDSSVWAEKNHVKHMDQLFAWTQSVMGHGRAAVWMHAPLYVCLLISHAMLHVILSQQYSDLGTIPKIKIAIPYNASIPITQNAVLMNYSSIAQTNDVQYLANLLKYKETLLGNPLNGNGRLLGPLWSPGALFVGTSGLFLVFLAMIELFWSFEHLPLARWPGKQGFMVYLRHMDWIKFVPGVLLGGLSAFSWASSPTSYLILIVLVALVYLVLGFVAVFKRMQLGL